MTMTALRNDFEFGRGSMGRIGTYPQCDVRAFSSKLVLSIPDSESFGLESKTNTLSFAGGERNSLETLQCPHRLRHIRALESNVELHHFFCGALARVRDLGRDRQNRTLAVLA